jgi:hypothetical protein
VEQPLAFNLATEIYITKRPPIPLTKALAAKIIMLAAKV